MNLLDSSAGIYLEKTLEGSIINCPAWSTLRLWRVWLTALCYLVNTKLLVECGWSLLLATSIDKFAIKQICMQYPTNDPVSFPHSPLVDKPWTGSLVSVGWLGSAAVCFSVLQSYYWLILLNQPVCEGTNTELRLLICFCLPCASASITVMHSVFGSVFASMWQSLPSLPMCSKYRI